MKKVTIVVAILKDLMKIDSLSRCFSSIKSQQGVNKEVIVVSNFHFNSQIKDLIKPTEGLAVFWENYSTLSLFILFCLFLPKKTTVKALVHQSRPHSGHSFYIGASP